MSAEGGQPDQPAPAPIAETPAKAPDETTDNAAPPAQPPAPEGPVREVVPHDPWAHRRGEPRVFAFLWTMFLFAATAATFLAALSTGTATPDVMRPATRALLALVAAGIVVVWPMVRLSQRADQHPIGGVVQDLVVVLIPAQAVVWPQWLAWLGRWPLEVIAAIAALLTAWGLLVGGLLANAQINHMRHDRRNDASRPGWNGAGWMAAFIVLGCGGMLIPLLTGGNASNLTGQPQNPVRISWMLSAITGVYEVLRDRSWTGTSAAVSREHWVAIAAIAAVGLLVWAVAGVRSRGREEYGSLH